MVVYIALVCICLIFSTVCIALYFKYKKMLYVVLCAMKKAIHDNTLHTLLHALIVSPKYSPRRKGIGRYPANPTKTPTEWILRRSLQSENDLDNYG